MTKEELLKILEDCKEENNSDTQYAHMDADEALLKFINDEDITKSFNSIRKWYA